MTDVGQIERKTQDRVVRLFKDSLDYEYLGNWEARQGTSNVDLQLLEMNLEARRYGATQIGKAVERLKRDASLGGRSLSSRMRHRGGEFSVRPPRWPAC
jgi:type I restriction enzyme R subunit